MPWIPNPDPQFREDIYKELELALLVLLFLRDFPSSWRQNFEVQTIPKLRSQRVRSFITCSFLFTLPNANNIGQNSFKNILYSSINKVKMIYDGSQAGSMSLKYESGSSKMTRIPNADPQFREDVCKKLELALLVLLFLRDFLFRLFGVRTVGAGIYYSFFLAS
jgi:hypothetical protein